MNKLKELYARAVKLRSVPAIDDDFPEFLHRFDTTMAELNRRETIPTIVCLCGSTKFKDAFDNANYHLTMQGNIVLSVGFFMHATGNMHGESIGATPEQKAALDELHKRKIDLADEVYVLNVGGYIGDSTRSEIIYANRIGTPVFYLEPI